MSGMTGASPMPGGQIDPMMGDPMSNIDAGMTPEGDMSVPNPYEADFDAGVEANEETDPKKYIQQLTGKLSQSLRKYNEGLPQPDADLNKYVAGMIVKQCIEGLAQEDVQDILKKIGNDEEEKSDMGNNDMPQEGAENATQPMGAEEMGGGMPPMNETMTSRQSSVSTGKEKTTKAFNDKITDRKSYHKSPWVGKTFKKS